MQIIHGGSKEEQYQAAITEINRQLAEHLITAEQAVEYTAIAAKEKEGFK